MKWTKWKVDNDCDNYLWIFFEFMLCTFLFVNTDSCSHCFHLISSLFQYFVFQFSTFHFSKHESYIVTIIWMDSELFGVWFGLLTVYQLCCINRLQVKIADSSCMIKVHMTVTLSCQKYTHMLVALLGQTNYIQHTELCYQH